MLHCRHLALTLPNASANSKTLKRGQASLSAGSSQLLGDLQRLVAKHPDVKVLSDHLAYLEKREEHLQYPTYQAQGWPTGSVMVESTNKVVVEVRLKGAGMHWARQNVNGMLALRNALGNQHWDEA